MPQQRRAGGGTQLSLHRAAINGNPLKDMGGGRSGNRQDTMSAADLTASHMNRGDHNPLRLQQVQSIAYSRHICHGIQGNPYFMCRTNGDSGELCTASWSGSSFTWKGTKYQNANQSGETYRLVALIAMDE